MPYVLGLHPYVDFGLKLLGGDLMAIPRVYGFVQVLNISFCLWDFRSSRCRNEHSKPWMELSKLMKLEVKIVHIRIYEEMGMIVVPLQDLVELEQKTMDLNGIVEKWDCCTSLSKRYYKVFVVLKINKLCPQRKCTYVLLLRIQILIMCNPTSSSFMLMHSLKKNCLLINNL